MKSCNLNKEQRKSCINYNYNKINICLHCKRFYENLPNQKTDLYFKKQEDKI